MKPGPERNVAGIEGMFMPFFGRRDGRENDRSFLQGLKPIESHFTLGLKPRPPKENETSGLKMSPEARFVRKSKNLKLAKRRSG
jgi:hypothetical protein